MSLFEQDLPPGLIYVSNWLSDIEHEKVLEEVDGLEFDLTLSRRVQHYGAKYDYGSASLNAPGTAPPIPPGIQVLGQRLLTEGYFTKEPDQVIVNEYVGNQGIAGHVDRTSFGEAVATVSLLESWQMLFRSPFGDKSEVLLERCSLAVMTGESRYEWTHEIAKRKFEPIGGIKAIRGRRISLTFRTVL
jgi:alkylated DNA repair dioxygenase AlkB